MQVYLKDLSDNFLKGVEKLRLAPTVGMKDGCANKIPCVALSIVDTDGKPLGQIIIDTTELLASVTAINQVQQAQGGRDD